MIVGIVKAVAVHIIKTHAVAKIVGNVKSTVATVIFVIAATHALTIVIIVMFASVVRIVVKVLAECGRSTCTATIIDPV